MRSIVNVGLAFVFATGFGRTVESMAQGRRALERVSSLYAHLEPSGKNESRIEWGRQTQDGKKISFATSFPGTDGKFRNQVVQLDRSTNTLKVLAELAPTAQKSGGGIVVLDQSATGSTVLVRLYFEQAMLALQQIPEQLPPGYLNSDNPPGQVDLLLDANTGKFQFINLNLSNSPVVANPTKISSNGRYVFGFGDRGQVDELGIYEGESVFIVRDLVTNSNSVVPLRLLAPAGTKTSYGDVGNVDDNGRFVATVSWTPAAEAEENEDSRFFDGVFFVDPATQSFTRIDRNAATNLNCDSEFTGRSLALRVHDLTYTSTPQNERVVFRKRACGSQDMSLWSWDRATSATTLIRTSTAAAEVDPAFPSVGEADLTDLDISANGRYLSLTSISKLSADDKSKPYDHFVLDLPSGTYTLTTVDSQATQAGVCDALGIDDNATVSMICRGQKEPFAAAPARRDLFGESAPYLYVSAIDQCASDNDKVVPGAFGCGVSETDTNRDGIVEKGSSSGNGNNGGGNNNGNENENVPASITSIVGTLSGRKLTCQALNGKAPVSGAAMMAEAKKGRKTSKLASKTTNTEGKATWTVVSGTQKATCVSGNLRVAAKKMKK